MTIIYKIVRFHAKQFLLLWRERKKKRGMYKSLDRTNLDGTYLEYAFKI